MKAKRKYRSAYWDSYYSDGKVPDLPSQFGVFILSEFPKADYIIDVGCGNGRDTFFFARHGKQVLSVDGSAESIKRISQEAARSGLPITAMSTEIDADDLLENVEHHAQEAGLKGKGLIYARFFIHAINKKEQGAFLDFCRAYLEKHGGHVALEFRTRMDENLTKVTGTHYRRYVDTVSFMEELFKRDLGVTYMVQGTGYAKYKDDDAHVVRLLIKPRTDQDSDA